jgi:hypothetical protein
MFPFILQFSKYRQIIGDASKIDVVSSKAALLAFEKILYKRILLAFKLLPILIEQRIITMQSMPSYNAL